MTVSLGTRDVLIIGGGIIGLATAYRLIQKAPRRSIAVLEKEAALAQHQTGHNSGVIHSGIYYKPGSLKATNCRVGRWALIEFCCRENILFEICGKIILATAHHELPLLHKLHERAQANGVLCDLIDPPRLRELEPHCAGLQALHIPEAGIVDYSAICQRLARKIADAGHPIVTNAKVLALEERSAEAIVESTAGTFHARTVVNCAGLHSDRVTALAGMTPSVKIVPFRGEYYKLQPSAPTLCRNLIYPVPDSQFPFLGVHFTRMIHGGVECGPNAVLAFAREGYRKTDLNLRDLAEALAYPGFRKLAARHWRMGLEEIWRSFSKRAFVRALQRLVPAVQPQHLSPAPSGIRAQAITPDGAMVDDFAIDEQQRFIHVINAPSPAATASLSIGELIADRILTRF